jgi:hypothetical protein
VRTGCRVYPSSRLHPSVIFMPDRVVGQFEIFFSISSMVRRWSVSPACIAGVTRKV